MVMLIIIYAYTLTLPSLSAEKTGLSYRKSLRTYWDIITMYTHPYSTLIITQ